ncbi:hypothetical protein [Rhizobium sp. LC145]|jgi:hypothetical protein|uniref:hypothetical protein n=1 Tax=Rhizobium sp. LC145 TaxID=1120688 RepID=UPI000629FB43|nr:hypothetical protein [Rhizobium sp. LC145]KKX29468.1 hypothetical protein YH62_17080 [Rhizobium sp. LC145]TKT66152.1 hypothetical protein FDR95_06600 [Rhizobiaceae bacterium LC148]
MTNLIAKLGIAALVALTGFSAVPNIAAASSPEFGIQQVQYREGERHYRPGRPDRPGRPGRPDRRPGCSPWLAVEKARHMGLRRARVVGADRRVVVVSGFDRRGRDRVIFANRRGCPIIRR